MSTELSTQHQDIDALETKEWLEALQSVIEADGSERARFLLRELSDVAREAGARLPYGLNTPYINTIPVDKQPALPADRQIEFKIRSMIRWIAAAMVLRANPLLACTLRRAWRRHDLLSRPLGARYVCSSFHRGAFK